MWSTWAGDQRCEPAAVERPSDVGEVVGAVERAVAARRGVRVAGSGHSFTAAVLTDGTLLSLDRMAALAEVLDGLDERVETHRHFEFFVFPHADSALTRTNEVVDEPPRSRPHWRAWVDDILRANRAFQLACVIGRAFPRAIPSLNRLVTRLSGTSTRIDRSDRIFASPRLVRFAEREYALPRAVAADAVRAIKATAERYAINFPIEVRFVAPDDALLSPAHQRETVYVAVHAFKGMAWEPYFRAVEAIADEHGGRPHRGKRHFHTAATLAPRYPEWERFAAVRARFDPAGVFANAYTDRVLGPASAV
jgi:L-gulono-1,4-lactone dehydrogenase